MKSLSIFKAMSLDPSPVIVRQAADNLAKFNVNMASLAVKIQDAGGIIQSKCSESFDG